MKDRIHQTDNKITIKTKYELERYVRIVKKHNLSYITETGLRCTRCYFVGGYTVNGTDMCIFGCASSFLGNIV